MQGKSATKKNPRLLLRNTVGRTILTIKKPTVLQIAARYYRSKYSGELADLGVEENLRK